MIYYVAVPDSMSSRLKFDPIRVSGGFDGRLVLLDGTLIAVLSLLDGSHDELEGRWFPEAALDGYQRMASLTFGSLDEAAEWVSANPAKGRVRLAT